MIRTIIIDDEHHGRQALSLALTQYCPEVEIVAICEDGKTGIASIRKLKPDLVFLDIQMPEMSGFDVLKQLDPIDFEVIFVTSFDQYAIKAIRFSALDYLLKPIDVDDLIHAVAKADKHFAPGSRENRYQSVLNNIHRKDGKIQRLAVPSIEGIDFFDTDDVVFCEADGSYTSVHLVDNTKKLVTRRLKEFENILKDSGFCRVHHSFLINISHVQKYVKGEGGYVVMRNGQKVDISRRKKDEFLNLLDRI